jgi:hypothetical protein
MAEVATRSPTAPASRLGSAEFDPRTAINEVEPGKITFGDRAVAGKRLYLCSLNLHKNLVPCPERSCWTEIPVLNAMGLPAVDTKGAPLLKREYHRVNLSVEVLPVWATDAGAAKNLFDRYSGIRKSEQPFTCEIAPGQE